MKTALITGANKGIGFEIVRQLAQKDFFVYLGSRDLEKGKAAVAQLSSEGLTNIAAVQMEVSNQASVDAARKIIGENSELLDVLVNCAGISGGFPQSALNATISQFREVFETNVFGIATVTQAFIDLLKRSTAPRIVNVTSAMGSLTLAADKNNPAYNYKLAVYQSSKAALNMYTINLAFELRDTPFKVNAVCPGWTQTDFTNHQGTSTTDQAAERIIKIALIGADGPTGQFFSEENFAYPVNCPW